CSCGMRGRSCMIYLSLLRATDGCAAHFRRTETSVSTRRRPHACGACLAYLMGRLLAIASDAGQQLLTAQVDHQETMLQFGKGTRGAQGAIACPRHRQEDQRDAKAENCRQRTTLLQEQASERDTQRLAAKDEDAEGAISPAPQSVGDERQPIADLRHIIDGI